MVKVLKIAQLGLNPLINRLISRCENLKMLLRTRPLALPKSGIFDKFRIMHFILDMIACSTKVLCQKNEQKMSSLESIFFFHTDQVMSSYFNLKSEQKMSKIFLKLGAKIPSIGS